MTRGGLLLDTCVVIDLLRQHAAALEFVRKMSEPASVPTIVIGEVMAGIREGDERTQFDRFITGWRVIQLSQSIASAGGLLARRYRPSHNVSLIDALIAATAIETKSRLVTCNLKHFPMLTDVIKPN